MFDFSQLISNIIAAVESFFTDAFTTKLTNLVTGLFGHHDHGVSNLLQ